VSVAVPDGVEAISNGVMPRPPVRETLGYTRWSWRSLKPQATYLTSLVIGQYNVTTDTTANGQTVYNAYSALLPQDFADAARSSVERTAEITDWESAEWLWSERQGEGTAQEIFDYLYATDPADTWSVAPADPGLAQLFGDAVYDRGAMTLHQLRLAVGDDDFFTTLRTWAADHRYGNAGTAEFTALAEKISGKDLGALFQAWLYTPSKPVVAAAAAKKAVREPKSWPQIAQTHALLSRAEAK
jgi:aminopeptidase N